MGFTRPAKRRKLAPLSTSNVSLPKDPLVKPIITPAPVTAAISTCVSCHRALKATQGLLVVCARYACQILTGFISLTRCARCSAPTCAICSRTCTACPSSMPPTPFLTRSSTPNPPPSSPKRPAVSLHATNTHRGEKRRKNGEEDSQEGFLQTLAEFDLVPGCGRTVCRNCCTENKERCVCPTSQSIVAHCLCLLTLCKCLDGVPRLSGMLLLIITLHSITLHSITLSCA